MTTRVESSDAPRDPIHVERAILHRLTPSSEDVANAVRVGLLGPKKHLPAWLFYDREGSRLFEEITTLEEYYPTRAERSILGKHGDAIVRAAAHGATAPLQAAELGAGTATKTQLLLEAIVRRQGAVTFLATDVSEAPLRIAAERLSREVPGVLTRELVGTHERALDAISMLDDRQMVLFLGSSIGNYIGDAATALVRSIRHAVRPGAIFVLGTDLRKDPDVLVRAYDDARGVTAAFNKNVLTRINRELDARFELDRFRHVALWNDAGSRIEMHLESVVDQVVPVGALGVNVVLRRGERIHTESSVKYDDSRIDALFASTGFSRIASFDDDDHRFAVHVARAM